MAYRTARQKPGRSRSLSARLFLFRHGRAAPPGLLIGQADVPLSVEGEAQARFWRDALAGLAFSAAWSSPLARARRTAMVILSGNQANTRNLTVVPDFREVSLGRWEGRDTAWIKQHYAREWEARGKNPTGIAPPGGESFNALAERVLPAFSSLCREASRHEFSLLAAHQAVNRVILSHALGVPLARMQEIPQDSAALTVLAVTEQGAKVLERYNSEGKALF